MNMFFQSLLAKFLDEYLAGVKVVCERPLSRGNFSAPPHDELQGRNPTGRSAARLPRNGSLDRDDLDAT